MLFSRTDAALIDSTYSPGGGARRGGALTKTKTKTMTLDLPLAQMSLADKLQAMELL